MTSAPMLRLGTGRREADGGAERDPVGILAGDVPAIDQVDGEYLVGPVAHAGLKPRLHHACDLRGSGLAVRLDRPLQRVGELPVEADAIGQIVPIDRAIPEPAA